MYSLRGKKKRRKERDKVKKRKKTRRYLSTHEWNIFTRLSVKWESHAYMGPEANVFEVFFV